MGTNLLKTWMLLCDDKNKFQISVEMLTELGNNYFRKMMILSVAIQKLEKMEC